SLPGGQGWVSADFVIATNVENVPVIASPPTPVPTPTPVPPTPVPPTRTPMPAPPPQAQINFWADRTQINLGECATLNWNVQNVQAVWVYPLGSDFSAFPRTGVGNERVCPPVTTTYEMRVLMTDGSTQLRQVTINVIQPIAPPQPPPVATQPIAPPQPPVEANPLAGTRWNVMNVNNGMGAVVGLVAGSTITMDFGTGGQLQGSAGCNTYSATYNASGDALTISPPRATQMYCDSPEGVMQQEQQFLAALQSAAAFQITGDRLYIRSPGGALAVSGNRAP
ncbi:MAG: META domain-containing protein, partial [Nitrososphaerales archaeon]